MKKILVSLVGTVMLLGLANLGITKPTLPPAFEKAKTLATISGVQSNGSYMLVAPNGEGAILWEPNSIIVIVLTKFDKNDNYVEGNPVKMLTYSYKLNMYFLMRKNFLGDQNPSITVLSWNGANALGDEFLEVLELN